MKDQVSQPYQTKGKIRVLYSLNFIFLKEDVNTTNSVPNGSKYFPPIREFLNVSVVPTYLNFALLSEDFLPHIMF
jgi:hypothetical protein